jgi:hypothetical protein
MSIFRAINQRDVTLTDSVVRAAVDILATAAGVTVRRWCDAADKGSSSWGGETFAFRFMGGESRRHTGDFATDTAAGDLNSVMRRAYEERVASKEGLMSGFRGERGGTVLR